MRTKVEAPVSERIEYALKRSSLQKEDSKFAPKSYEIKLSHISFLIDSLFAQLI